jgi:hypothetical protein
VLYGSENWTIKARDARRVKAAETKCMRKTAGCTWTACKRTKQNPRFGQNTGTQKKLFATYKQNIL